MKTEFDEVAQEYDELMNDVIGSYGKDVSYYALYKILLVKDNVNKNPVKILEFGCGIGRNLSYFKEFFPNSKMHGYDPSIESIKIAKQNNKEVIFLQKEELKEFQFDLIFVAGVFHHIPINSRFETMKFIKSLLSNTGELFVFEHNPFNPVTRKAVSTCPFDKGVTLLKPKELENYVSRAELNLIKRKYCLLFPAFLKKLRPMEKLFSSVPFGGQYYVKAKMN